MFSTSRTASQRDASTSRDEYVFYLGFHVFSFLELQREAVRTFLGIVSELRSAVSTGESLNCKMAIFPCLVRPCSLLFAFRTFPHSITVGSLLLKTYKIS